MSPTTDRHAGRRLVSATRLRRWELRIERAAIATLDRRRARALAAIRTVTAAPPPPDPFGVDTWDGDIEADIEPVAGEVLGEAAQVVAKALGAEHLTPIDVTARVQRLVGLVRDLGPATADQLAAALQQGVGAGEGIDKLAARVQTVFDSSASRARTIARTEVVSASNGAAHDAAMTLASTGMQLTKEWLSTSDDRTRDVHADADGQVVAVDQPFDVGGESLMYPGDESGSAENTINCRCSVVFSGDDGPSSSTIEDSGDDV